MKTILFLLALTGLAHADLRARAHNLPDIKSTLVDEVVDAALAEQTPEIGAALLISLCWAESRCERLTHDNTGCGVLQVDPKDLDEPASKCAEYAISVRAGIAVGVRELEMLLADHRVHHDLRKALQYRACGNKAFDGTCSTAKLQWVEGALYRAKVLRGTLGTWTTSRS